VHVDSIRRGECVVSVPFSLRVRLGRCEVEISGSREEVLKTVSDLQSLLATIFEAFSQAGVDASGVGGVESGLPRQASSGSAPVSASVGYPSIQSSGNCSDAVLRLLETNWGRATPRTLPELVEALRSNAVHYPATTLSGVLNWLVRRGRVKRWKTDKGYVYVLAGPNVAHGGAQVQTEASVTSSGGA